jgi:hypothetical protein
MGMDQEDGSRGAKIDQQRQKCQTLTHKKYQDNINVTHQTKL